MRDSLPKASIALRVHRRPCYDTAGKKQRSSTDCRSEFDHSDVWCWIWNFGVEAEAVRRNDLRISSR